jgi:putative membrane protein
MIQKKWLLQDDAKLVGGGFLMGGANIIPGVSGGTVALILGIYQRLVTAISQCDFELLLLIGRRHWKAAGAHIDLRFLAALGLGILTGTLCLAGLMNYLLLEHRAYTLSVFFGLILASSVVVGRMIRLDRARDWAQFVGLSLIATLLAYQIVGMGQFQSYEHPGYYFCCGALAICAMILPGISGAHILWLLGTYESITSMIAIGRVLQWNWTGQELVQLVAFVAGCLIGLISFSKVLRVLLTSAESATMAVLCGIMIGSLRRVWPFQQELAAAGSGMKHRPTESILPPHWDGHVTICLLLAVAAFAAVLVLHRLASRP